MCTLQTQILKRNASKWLLQAMYTIGKIPSMHSLVRPQCMYSSIYILSIYVLIFLNVLGVALYMYSKFDIHTSLNKLKFKYNTPERLLLDTSLILDNLNFPGRFSFKWL
jgi:hypothetical protein